MEKRTDRLTYKSPHGGYGYSHDLDMYDPDIKNYIGRLEDEKDEWMQTIQEMKDYIEKVKGLIE